ncbi:PREDICTED: uncharacterized protein LOC108374739 [Rhagoletis zephyria]|uniref:uncharacterized protein LOC108374739 n=1 Tax=Rhagoletis zephyria TaxID=28612 RepID=UPI0008115C51|nr:PREDICTED: uncharacterized protein LOC108374739 [Rhagoletis zephyria]XP_036323172.1 uncharacterized protein LOC118737040 [Rhagoletis pomonella]
MKKTQTFLRRNSVAIVMIPSIIGIHYAWNLMQKNRTLVAADEEIDLPVVTFAKYCWSRVQGLTGSEQSVENTSKPATATAAVK